MVGTWPAGEPPDEPDQLKPVPHAVDELPTQYKVVVISSAPMSKAEPKGRGVPT